MNFFHVPTRAGPVPASHHAPARSVAASISPASRERDVAAPMPNELTVESRIPAPPGGVSPFAWEMLVVNVVDAQRQSASSLAPLRAAVQAVVRELRAASQAWEQVYAVLQGVVPPVPERLVTWAMGYETHSSRSAALVAHMQSWADVERLAEIEAEAHAG